MSKGDWFVPIFLLAMAQRELVGRHSIWFLFLAVFEGGQRGEVFSREGDEQWLLKGSQGLGLDNLVANSAGLACMGEVPYEQVRYG